MLYEILLLSELSATNMTLIILQAHMDHKKVSLQAKAGGEFLLAAFLQAAEMFFIINLAVEHIL